MLELVTATRFHRWMKNGRTRPCLFSCSDAGDREVEVVCKFSSGCELGVYGLACEAIAAMLAKDLGLPVPRPLIAFFQDDFIQILKEQDQGLASFIQSGPKSAFGSTLASPGFITIPKGIGLNSLHHIAAEIFAFDALITNSDRKVGNANCLSDGSSFALIDHEMCFMGDLILFWSPPWVPGALSGTVHDHIFFQELKGTAPNFNRLKEAWSSISSRRLEEYFNALPPEWITDLEKVKKIFYYLDELRDKINPAFAEVERVLE